MPVTNPTAEQRRNLPDAAFAAVFEATGGTRRRILPHHINTVKSATDNATVDVPRLRNAFARFNQLKSVSKTVKTKAMAHLQAHADAVLRRDNSDAGLRAVVDDFDRGLAVAHHYSLHDIADPTFAERVEAEGMHLAARAAIQLLEGETLEAFRQGLNDTVKLAWQNVLGEHGYCYLEAIFKDTLVAYIHAEGQPSVYMMHAWMRMAGGEFIIGAPAKVRPVVSYEPEEGDLPTAMPPMPMTPAD